MLRGLKAWWTMLTQIGPAMKLGRQADQLYRYYIIGTLQKEGLFDYLQQPRTYGHIVAEFGYVDSAFTRDLLDVLVKDKKNVLLRENGQYVVNTAQPIPHLEDIIGSTHKRLRSFTSIAEGLTRTLPARMRNVPVEFTGTFEQDSRQLLVKFDKALGNRIYSALRNTAFAILSKDELQHLRGKRLLDIGCGSGRETAEVWLKMNGDIHIIAVDPVPGLLDLARENFDVLLDEIDPGHPPVKEDNRPEFKIGSATALPFEDGYFDAVFHSTILHWTPDPQKAIAEIVRVTRPGGLIFGTQGTKPYLNPYFDLAVRTSENAHGTFWREDFVRWYRKHGLELEIVTPAGAFRGCKPRS